MKFLPLLILLLSAQSSWSSETFGGIKFHSEIPSGQLEVMKKDLTFLFNMSSVSTDTHFLNLTQMQNGSGPNLHRWLINRAKYMIPENFDLQGRNRITKAFHRFPQTPDVSYSRFSQGLILMSNEGSLLYVSGKRNRTLTGINFDNEKVLAKSPRVGIFKLGAGHFNLEIAVNDQMDSSANKIFRLGTLFHEARHSDGNGAHAGFLHKRCPPGHAYYGYAACDDSDNGSYSIGAASERQLALNCSDCSIQDKTTLAALQLDHFSRIVRNTNSRQNSEQLKRSIATYEDVIKNYESKISMAEGSEKIRYQREVDFLKISLDEQRAELQALKVREETPVLLDPTPEGDFKDYTLQESVRLMTSSLQR